MTDLQYRKRLKYSRRRGRDRRVSKALLSEDSFAKAVDPVERIERLIAGADKKLQVAFIQAITRIRDAATLQRLENLLLAGHVELAVDVGEEAIAEFADEWVEVYIQAARDTAGFVGRELSVISTFDVVNSRAVQALQQNRLRLIREIVASQRDAVRTALVEGTRLGLNPRAQARAFRDAIGLTARQEGAVQNFRRLLEELDPAALSRKLRDARFDSTIREAIDFESPLKKSQINRMVARYRERSIKHRSEVIGRTEALRSVHEGVEEQYRQAIDAGHIDPDEFVRVWNTSKDGRVRDFDSSATSHVSMHLQERELGEAFQSGAGNSLRFPGDVNAPALDTIQCRCVLSTRFKRPEPIGG